MSLLSYFVLVLCTAQKAMDAGKIRKKGYSTKKTEIVIQQNKLYCAKHDALKLKH